MNQSGRPIIVLGAARSGTKFLRDTLAADPGALATPYDLNFVWRSGNESATTDDLCAADCSEKQAQQIRSELLRQAGIAPGSELRLVEKTVSNTVRVDFVSKVFPDADYVHIIRDGRHVTASSIEQWMKPTNYAYLFKKLGSFSFRHYRYGLWFLKNLISSRGDRDSRPVWGVRYPGIADDMQTLPLSGICARQWTNSVNSVRQASNRNPSLRMCEVRFESLLESEDEWVKLADWLHLTGKDDILDYYRNNVRRSAPRQWEDKVPEHERAMVLRELHPLLDELGYS